MNRKEPRELVRSLLTTALNVVLLGSVALGQANVTGQWTTLPNLMPINPVHATLLNNGKILVLAGSGNCPPSQSGCPAGAPYGASNSSGAGLYDPTARTFTQFTLLWDMFCNSMLTLPDGRVLIDGGTIQYDPFHGQSKVSIFDPATNSFTDINSMAHGRWYPTLTNLGDGRVMVFSGLDENGSTNSTVEIYTTSSGWGQQLTAGWTPPLYPRMHLLPNGNVFYAGSGTQSKIFNPATATWTNSATTIYTGTRTYGSSVLLPLTPANGYDPKVIILGGNSPATNTTEIIDLGAQTPKWVSGSNMSQARIEMSAVLLPNGKVLAMGGSVNDEDTTTKSLNADVIDPNANVTQNRNAGTSSAGANAFARLYHSVAVLLPDATVWFAGGNPTRGSYEQHMEIYKPAYLFNSSGALATRPTISSAPSQISWGNQFTVLTPDAADISSVILMRPGSPTHAFDQSQRMVGMSFTAGAGSLTVTAPPNGNVSPPGYYMLFLINSTGVPSVAPFLMLSSPAADFGLTTTPASQTISPAGATSYSATVTPTNGFIGTVTFSVSGLPTGATGTFNPASVTSSGSSTLNVSTQSTVAPGSYTLTITGTSGTLTHSTPITLTVATGTAASPTFSPAPGSYTGSVSVTLSDSTPGAIIHCTTDGSTPSALSPVCFTLNIRTTTQIQAIATANGLNNSAIAFGNYTITGGGGGGPIAFVQSNATGIGSGTSVSAAYKNAQAAGNLNVVAVGWADISANIVSVTDSKGNVYSLAGNVVRSSGLSPNLTGALYYATNIAAAAANANTVTVTFGSSARAPEVQVFEYSGVNTLDAASGNYGTGTTANSGSAVTTGSSDLIFGAGMPVGGFTAAGSGFTKRQITSFGSIGEDETVTTAGSYSATAAVTTGGWVMQMAAFKSGGGNPAPSVSAISPNSGSTAGGTAVSISGTGFLTGATVSIGGTAASNVNVISSTSLTAVTGAHAAGVASVVVTNSDTQSGTLNNGYTYDTGGGGGGLIAFVQSNAVETGSASTVGVTFRNAQVAGDLNVVVIGWADVSRSVSSVTDSLGNVYSIAVAPTRSAGLSPNLTQVIYYASNITGAVGNSNTVTVTFSGAATAPDVQVFEYSGVSALDAGAGAFGTGTTANSGSAVTTGSSDLIFGAGMPVGGFTAAGSGFTKRQITSFGSIGEDETVTTAGSYSATAAVTTGGWVMQMAAFK